MPELLDLAELRAGAECDNLSVVAMTWAEKRPGAPPGEISTLELDGASTRLEDFGGVDHGDLSDAEIEQAIREIRAAIGKHTPKKPS
jgi:hypothetical protein